MKFSDIKYLILSAFLILFFFSGPLNAQPDELEPDEDFIQNTNFKELRKKIYGEMVKKYLYENRYESRTIMRPWTKLPEYEKFKGTRQEKDYIILKRWENLAQTRLNEKGEVINAGNILWEEIQRLNQIEKARFNRSGANCVLTPNWTNIGPFTNNSNAPANDNTNDSNAGLHKNTTPGIGRARVLTKHPANNDLYLGAANGGIWVSNDLGESWTEMNGSLPVLGTSDIVFDMVSTNQYDMYLVTGDGSRTGIFQGETLYSMGVLKIQ